MPVSYPRDVTPFEAAHGEVVYELIGRVAEQVSARHSVALIRIPPGKGSRLHRHPEAEESYAILRGRARVRLDDDELTVGPGATILIPATVVHQIRNAGDDELEFLAVCVPAWTPDNTEYLDGDGA